MEKRHTDLLVTGLSTLSDGFHINCTTCSSRLLVKDLSLHGQILSCPKCGSMVLIDVPESEISIESSLAASSPSSASPPSSMPSQVAANPATSPTVGGGTNWLVIGFATVGTLVCMTAVGWYAFRRSPDAPVQSTTLPGLEQVVLKSSVKKPASPLVNPESTETPLLVEDLPSTSPEPLRSVTDPAEIEFIADEVDPFGAAEFAAGTQQAKADLPVDPSVEVGTVDRKAIASLANLLGVHDRPQPSAPTKMLGESMAGSLSSQPPRDVRQNAEKMIRAVRFDRVPLVDFLRSMMLLSNVPIMLDPVALEQTGKLSTAVISVEFINGSTLDILDKALQPLGLRAFLQPKLIRIATRNTNTQNVVKSRFFIGDLHEGDEFDWENFITTLVDPTSWSRAGGSGTVHQTREHLQIENTRIANIHVAILLEKMRQVRQLPPRQNLPNHLVSLAPRWRALSRHLASPVDVTLWSKSSFVQVVTELQKASGLTILVDWHSLAGHGIGPFTEAKLYARDVQVEEALQTLLSNENFELLPIDSQTIQITSATQQASSLYLEFYSFDRQNQSGRELIEQQMLQGRAALDPASDAAIVLGNSELHRALDASRQ